MTGLHIWCAIASWADQGMKAKLANVTDPDGTSEALFLTDAHQNLESPAVVVGPNKRDCVISIFLIVFGVVAAVVGVASNVYVQLEHIFHTSK